MFAAMSSRRCERGTAPRSSRHPIEIAGRRESLAANAGVEPRPAVRGRVEPRVSGGDLRAQGGELPRVAERNQRPVADPPARRAVGARRDPEHDRVRRCVLAPAGAQVLPQPDALGVSGALEHDVCGDVSRRGGVERAGELDSDRDPGSVVAGGGSRVGGRELEQQREREHERDRRRELDRADRLRRVALDPEDREHEQPDDRQRQPTEPARGEPAGESPQRAGGGAEALAIDEAGAASVVVRGDDQAYRRRLAARARGRRCDDVLARPLRGQPAARGDPDERVGEDRHERREQHQRAGLGRGDGHEAAREREPGVPHVRERPVRPAPERLDDHLPSGGRELVGQPLCRPSLRVAPRPTALELLEPRDCLECSHRAGMIAAEVSLTAERIRQLVQIERAAVTDPGESELLSVADEAAAAAASELVARFGDRAGALGTKSTPTDPVSEADLAAERAIREVLARRRPEDRVLGEEGGATGEGRLRWVVDPLDGTVNFLFGIPAFAVSIACEDASGALVGVVLDVMRGDRFAATRSGDATLNGEPIQGVLARRPRDRPGRDRVRLRLGRPRPPGGGRRAPAPASARHPPHRRGGGRHELVRVRALRRLLRAWGEGLGRGGRRVDLREGGARGPGPPRRRTGSAGRGRRAESDHRESCSSSWGRGRRCGAAAACGVAAVRGRRGPRSRRPAHLDSDPARR